MPPLEIGLQHLPVEKLDDSAALAPAPLAEAIPAPRVPEPRRSKSAAAPVMPEPLPSAPELALPAEAPTAPIASAASVSNAPAEIQSVGAGQAASLSLTPTGATPAAPVSVGALVEAVPLAGENPPPAYPRLARQRGWEGGVALRVRVSASGAVEEVWVESSSGHGVLDQAALTAVKSWRFRPARDGVKAVAGLARVPIEFRLRGG